MFGWQFNCHPNEFKSQHIFLCELRVLCSELSHLNNRRRSLVVSSPYALEVKPGLAPRNK